MEDCEDVSDPKVEKKPVKKRPKPKHFQIADKATKEKILQGHKKPEPEFKDKVCIVENGRLVLKSEQIFVCTEPGCNAYFAKEASFKHHLLKHLKKELKCGCCGRLFRNEEEKTEHENEFHPNLQENPHADPLKCKKCGKVSKNSTALWRHVGESHRKETFNCPVCQFTFTRPENLKCHMKTKHSLKKGAETISCEICRKEYKVRSAWRQHILDNHRKPKSYKCVICNTVHPSKFSYKAHLDRMHTKLISLNCDLCNYSGINRVAWRKHCKSMKHKQAVKKMSKSKSLMKHIHTETVEEPKVTFQELKSMSQAELLKFCWKRVPKIILYRCDTLKVERFSTLPENYEEEEMDSFEGVVYLKCVYCHVMEFPGVDEVESHERSCYKSMKTASDNICHLCGKRCRKPSQLKVHMMIHSKETPYKCSYCDKSFATAVRRIAHEKRIHFGISSWVKRPEKIPCSYTGCGKEFSSEETLRNHVSSLHLKIRHTCEICGNGYSKRDSLRDHMKTKHSGNLPIRLECKPCKRTYISRSSYLLHLKRPRHVRKRIELIRKKKSNEKQNQDSDVVVKVEV